MKPTVYDNMISESKNRNRFIYTAAFFIPVSVFFLMCAYMRRYPFGSLTILDMDLPGQYIHFFSYLKSILTGDNDFYYTFSKALGGDMTGLSTYYLLSPLNLIFLFIPQSAFPLGCTILAAVKLGLCGLSMEVFLRSMSRENSHGAGYWSLLFSSAYALMSYNIVYLSNIMWIDAVYVLPLMVLGIERLLNGRSAPLYPISLAYALICNYYTGYMLCLFSVFYFSFRFTVLLFEKRSGLWRILLRYVFFSLLAGGLAAFVLLPTFLSLSGTKASLDMRKLTMFRSFPFSAFVLRLFTNSVVTQLDLQNLPYLYTGLLCNVLLALYFFNSKVRITERLICLLFLFLLLLSFDLNGCYLIWHGFNYPACFPFRNAFVASFMMLHLAWQCFIHRDGLSIKSYAVAIFTLAAIIVVSKPFSNPDLSKSVLAIDLCVSTLILIILAVEKYSCSKRLCFAALALIQFVFIFENAVFLKSHATDGNKLDAAEYRSTIYKTTAENNYLSQLDDSFYRVGASPENINEAMQLDYASLSHFSSTDKSSVKDFIARFGYRFFRDSWVSYGNGNTASTDALFSVKYLRSDLGQQKNYPVIFDNDSGSVIRENPNALGIAFIADRSVLTSGLDTYNPFIRQNQIFSSILGENTEIFSTVRDLSFETTGIGETNTYEDGTVYFYDGQAEELSFIYRFKAASCNPVYMYSYAPYPDYVDLNLVAQLYVNGESLGEYMGPYTWETVYLGSFEPGQEVEVVIKPEHDYFILGESYIYHEDQTVLSDCVRTIKARTGDAELEKLSSSSLRWEGSVPADSHVLLLTIPNEQGWKLLVDGESAHISSAFNTLMALDLNSGKHTIELKYVPAGFYAGLAVSLSCAVFLTVYLTLIRKRKK